MVEFLERIRVDYRVANVSFFAESELSEAHVTIALERSEFVRGETITAGELRSVSDLLKRSENTGRVFASPFTLSWLITYPLFGKDAMLQREAGPVITSGRHIIEFVDEEFEDFFKVAYDPDTVISLRGTTIRFRYDGGQLANEEGLWPFVIEGPSEKDYAHQQLEKEFMKKVDRFRLQEKVYKIDAPIVTNDRIYFPPGVNYSLSDDEREKQEEEQKQRPVDPMHIFRYSDLVKYKDAMYQYDRDAYVHKSRTHVSNELRGIFGKYYDRPKHLFLRAPKRIVKDNLWRKRQKARKGLPTLLRRIYNGYVRTYRFVFLRWWRIGFLRSYYKNLFSASMDPYLLPFRVDEYQKQVWRRESFDDREEMKSKFRDLRYKFYFSATRIFPFVHPFLAMRKHKLEKKADRRRQWMDVYGAPSVPKDQRGYRSYRAYYFRNVIRIPFIGLPLYKFLTLGLKKGGPGRAPVGPPPSRESPVALMEALPRKTVVDRYEVYDEGTEPQNHEDNYQDPPLIIDGMKFLPIFNFSTLKLASVRWRDRGTKIRDFQEVFKFLRTKPVQFGAINEFPDLNLLLYYAEKVHPDVRPLFEEALIPQYAEEYPDMLIDEGIEVDAEGFDEIEEAQTPKHST